MFYQKLTEGFPVRVDVSPYGGRGIFAARSFQEGDIVFQEIPFISIENEVFTVRYGRNQSLLPYNYPY